VWRNSRVFGAFLLILSLYLVPGHGQSGSVVKSPTALIVEGARKQLDWGTRYDPAYYAIPYPNGDLPKDKGVCTDVVVRALRNAGYDLQKLIHEDMKANFSKYPQIWGLKGPDRNIDHRRTPNQMTFFQRFGKTLTHQTSQTSISEWQPGDIVFWKLPNGMNHVGILSDRRNRRGLPFVIHNISTTSEEDVLEAWPIIGHYRYPKESS
jgi:uncharacterized protein YijF (DUF1287 family)